MASPFWKNRGQPQPVTRETAPERPMFPGRPQYTGTWEPGVVSKPLDRRNWVQHRHGINGAVSTVPKGRWVRGPLYRHSAPEFVLPQVGFWMYDPTSLVAVPGLPARAR